MQRETSRFTDRVRSYGRPHTPRPPLWPLAALKVHDWYSPSCPGEKRPVINFKPPAENPTLPGYAVVPTEGNSGYAEIYSIERDPETGEAFGAASSSSKYRYPWGLESYTERIEHRTNDLNPAKTSVRGIYSYMVDLEDRTIRMEQEVEFFSIDDKNFRMTFTRRFLLDGKMVHEKQWDELIPRDFQ